ncbi:hypothetical protein [Pedobacter rhizosphaerae]|uniref:Uncharacterized protein n=1 Tax=Pedobacter rhizosphaerae TaxID=390241 RepID=A0A1H9TYF5_9SPHI|nr:hypothetical protein [Pedobacter rhizosphaerae]SES01773.1 hypothetical protein SAMN04488023_12536 [Pedobacter rhizosphaerae]
MSKYIQNAVLIILLLMNLSCRKNVSVIEERELDQKNLTPCSTGDCSYRYTRWNDLDSLVHPITGSFRVFVFEVNFGEGDMKIFLKAPMEGVAFSIDQQDFKNGKVIFQRNCPSCRIAALSPQTGRIRGLRIARDDPFAPETWIVEANLVLTDSGKTLSRQIYFKQRFYPDSISPKENKSQVAD